MSGSYSDRSFDFALEIEIDEDLVADVVVVVVVVEAVAVVERRRR